MPLKFLSYAIKYRGAKYTNSYFSPPRTFIINYYKKIEIRFVIRDEKHRIQDTWNSSVSDYTVPSARNYGGFSRQSSREAPHSSRRYYERLSDYIASWNSFGEEGGGRTGYILHLKRVTGTNTDSCIYSSAKVFKRSFRHFIFFSSDKLWSCDFPVMS